MGGLFYPHRVYQSPLYSHSSLGENDITNLRNSLLKSFLIDVQDEMHDAVLVSLNPILAYTDDQHQFSHRSDAFQQWIKDFKQDIDEQANLYSQQATESTEQKYRDIEETKLTQNLAFENIDYDQETDGNWFYPDED